MKLYGLGVGPGDPELVTVKAATLLGRCRDVFVPKARIKSESAAKEIAERYFHPEARVVELVFPMVRDREFLEERWRESAEEVAKVLRQGREACFLTLGDPMLYSTWIYLARAVRAVLPQAEVVTVPGVPAFCAVASLTHFPLGEGGETVTIVPGSEDPEVVKKALRRGGTVVLMKIGKRLEGLLDLLEREGLMEQGVFVSRAGFPDQQVECDLRKMRGREETAGYLSIVLVHAGQPSPVVLS